MMKIKITREDGSLHSFDFYKKERCVFSISENGDMYYSIYGNGEFAKTTWFDIDDIKLADK